MKINNNKMQNILAVDDEPDILRLLEKIISQKTNYGFFSTNNSLEVPRLLEENVYDLILLDMSMPGMSGIEILKLMRELKREEEVIIITAFGSFETCLECLSLGASQFIRKPFRKEEILNAVEICMEKQRRCERIDAFDEIISSGSFDEAVEKLREIYFNFKGEK